MSQETESLLLNHMMRLSSSPFIPLSPCPPPSAPPTPELLCRLVSPGRPSCCPPSRSSFLLICRSFVSLSPTFLLFHLFCFRLQMMKLKLSQVSYLIDLIVDLIFFPTRWRILTRNASAGCVASFSSVSLSSSVVSDSCHPGGGMARIPGVGLPVWAELTARGY